MRLIACHAALVPLLVLISTPAMYAQDRSAPTAQAAAKKQANPAAEFRALDKRIDRLYTKCDACKGRGKIKGADCARCWGTGQVPVQGRAQERLDAFLDYFELAERSADVLREPKNKKLAKRVHENQSLFLEEIINGIKPRHPYRPNQPERRGVWCVRESGSISVGCTALAGKLILSKSSPTGHGIAFSGQVCGVEQEARKNIAEVRLPITYVRGYHPPITCFVLVPDGVRWVTGAEVRVIGRVIDRSGFPRLRKDRPDAVLVRPAVGTE